MADRHHHHPNLVTLPPDHRRNNHLHGTIQRLHDQSPNSTHLLALLALAVSASILLLLAGATVAASALALIFFAPLIIISSPVWVPIAAFLFFASAALLSVCGFGVSAVAAASWLYRYVKGLNPPGARRVDYARSRIYDTACHVKDYAKEYGGYLQGKVKDAAPGA